MMNERQKALGYALIAIIGVGIFWTGKALATTPTLESILTVGGIGLVLIGSVGAFLMIVIMTE